MLNKVEHQFHRDTVFVEESGHYQVRYHVTYDIKTTARSKRECFVEGERLDYRRLDARSGRSRYEREQSDCNTETYQPTSSMHFPHHLTGTPLASASLASL